MLDTLMPAGLASLQAGAAPLIPSGIKAFLCSILAFLAKIKVGDLAARPRAAFKAGAVRPALLMATE